MRPATLSDLPRLFELVTEMHARSYYAQQDIGLHEQSAKAILRDAVMRNGGTGQGGCLLNVVERDGRIEGFMLGILQRVYHICNRLEAQDFWLFCTEHAPNGAVTRLLNGYIKWASENPKVAEIKLSWTDALGTEGDKIERLYRSKGFKPCGGIFKRAGQ